MEQATKPDAIVSCTSAQWICAADPECSEALEWYKRLCRPMFKGRKCTKKCQNTIETLRSLSKRQNAAKKLGKYDAHISVIHDIQIVIRNKKLIPSKINHYTNFRNVLLRWHRRFQM